MNLFFLSLAAMFSINLFAVRNCDLIIGEEGTPIGEKCICLNPKPYKMSEKKFWYGCMQKDNSIIYITKPLYDNAFVFSEGRAAVKIDKKWGYIDRNGDYVVSPKYDFAGIFEEGTANIKLNGKNGYINNKGQETFLDSDEK